MQKTILISGASSGIGRSAAVRFASNGYNVLAGVRTSKSAAELDELKMANLEPVFLDLTDTEGLESFFADNAGRFDSQGLYGLVNNAGSVMAGAIEFTPLDSWKAQFDVNFFGHIDLSRRAIPYIRKAKGRIVFISTLGGKVGYPLTGPYCASKHALEGAADSFRRELYPFGTEVSIVEPGGTATRMLSALGAAAADARSRISGDGAEGYLHVATGLSSAAEQFKGMSTDPEKVVDAIAHALFAKRPKIRYRVGTDAKLLLLMHKLLPDRGMDFLLRKVMGIQR